MSGFWQTVLDIIVFLLSLSILVVIHEAGHLSAAKIFKVYCYEFSVGMGPLIYQKKPNKQKKQETAFSIRALPIGGYVSMAGEDLEDVEGVDKSIIVPHDRTLEGKSRWKQVIIMAAGVFMNFVLGYILLLFSFTACTQVTNNIASSRVYVNNEGVLKTQNEVYLNGNKVDNVTLSDGDYIRHVKITYHFLPEGGSGTDIKVETIESNISRYAYSNENDVDNKVELNNALNTLLSNVYYTETEKVEYPSKFSYDYREITFSFVKGNEVNNESELANIPPSKVYTTKVLSKATSNGGYETLGIGSYRIHFKYSFAEGTKVAWEQWCYYCSALFVSIAALFNPATWSQVGGVISIFKLSAQAQALGIGSFLNLWALISVNLAVMNLLPFPALDGWQILITICEGIYFNIQKLVRKIKYKMKKLSESELEQLKQADENKSLKNNKTYKKIKNIMSMVGMCLLIILMVVLVIKDIVSPAI